MTITVTMTKDEFDALDEIVREGWNGGEFTEAIRGNQTCRVREERIRRTQRRYRYRTGSQRALSEWYRSTEVIMATLTTYEKNKRNVKRLKNRQQKLQSHRGPQQSLVDKELQQIERSLALITYKCTGEAHSNAHIDNCTQCAPWWRVCVRRFTDDEICEVIEQAKVAPFTDELWGEYPKSAMAMKVEEAVALGLLGERASDNGPDMFYYLTESGSNALRLYDTRKKGAMLAERLKQGRRMQRMH